MKGKQHVRLYNTYLLNERCEAELRKLMMPEVVRDAWSIRILNFLIATSSSADGGHEAIILSTASVRKWLSTTTCCSKGEIASASRAVTSRCGSPSRLLTNPFKGQHQPMCCHTSYKSMGNPRCYIYKSSAYFHLVTSRSRSITST